MNESLRRLNSRAELNNFRDDMKSLAVNKFGWSSNAQIDKANDVTAAFLKVATWETACVIVDRKESMKNNIPQNSECCIAFNSAIKPISCFLKHKDSPTLLSLNAKVYFEGLLDVMGIHMVKETFNRLEKDNKSEIGFNIVQNISLCGHENEIKAIEKMWSDIEPSERPRVFSVDVNMEDLRNWIESL